MCVCVCSCAKSRYEDQPHRAASEHFPDSELAHISRYKVAQIMSVWDVTVTASCQGYVMLHLRTLQDRAESGILALEVEKLLK